jgi:NAD(P)H-dependent FMN reductase
MKPGILVILGSMREGRVDERVAHWLLRQLDGQHEAVFELLDLRSHPLPVYPGLSADRHDDAVQRWSELVAGADGYIVVTPEYNHGYPAALKSALDHAYEEWSRKPVAAPWASFDERGELTRKDAEKAVGRMVDDLL